MSRPFTTIAIGIVSVSAWAAAAQTATAPTQQPAVSASWKFDGNADDAGPNGWNGKGMGRVAYSDSPIGGQGQLLSLNGVDACVQVDQPAAGDLGEKDFSLGIWILPLEMRSAGLVQRGDPKAAWSLFTSPNGSVHFVANTTTGAKLAIESPPGVIEVGRWHFILLSVQRTRSVSAAAGAHLYIDGVLAANAPVAPGALNAQTPLMIGKGDGTGTFFNGLIDEVQMYSTALGAEDVARLTDAGLPWLRPKPWAKEPFDGRFSLRDQDVVVFSGGENTLAAQQAGYLETLLTLRSPSRRVFFRDMAWEGDTVFEQWRILNFGPWPYQLRRVGATVLIAQFGQMESLRGKAGLADFVNAYNKLLDDYSNVTRRIVLVSPIPFERSPSPSPDLSARNREVAAYALAIGEIANQRKLLFVDLFTPLAQPPTSGQAQPLTRDGIHLNAYGQWAVARQTAQQLGFDVPADIVNPQSQTPAFVQPAAQALCEEVRRKNAIWLSYWRPTNWAFLNGDRVSQPSSRDPRDPRVRWFPFEVQESAAMIHRAELKIADMAAATPSGAGAGEKK